MTAQELRQAWDVYSHLSDVLEERCLDHRSVPIPLLQATIEHPPFDDRSRWGHFHDRLELGSRQAVIEVNGQWVYGLIDELDRQIQAEVPPQQKPGRRPVKEADNG